MKTLAPMDTDNLADFVTMIDGPTFCGQLFAGEPHGVWLYFEEGGVRVVVWELGEIVTVLW